MREVLESYLEYVSSHLNDWIDLIFGYNVLHRYCMHMEEIKDKTQTIFKFENISQCINRPRFK